MLFLMIASFLLVMLVLIAALYVWAGLLDDAILDLSLFTGSFFILALLLPGFIDRITTQCVACWRDSRVAENDLIVLFELLFVAYLLRGLIKQDPLAIIGRRRRKT